MKQKHEHDGYITTTGRIFCRTCGEPLESTEKELGTFTSVKMTTVMLNLVAVEGKYTASAFSSDEFVLYSRIKNNTREEVTARKKHKRTFVIIKTVSTIQEG